MSEAGIAAPGAAVGQEWDGDQAGSADGNPSGDEEAEAVAPTRPATSRFPARPGLPGEVHSHQAHAPHRHGRPELPDDPGGREVRAELNREDGPAGDGPADQGGAWRRTLRYEGPLCLGEPG